MQKKILFCIKTPDAGGAETYLLRYMNYMRGNYTVLCKGGKGGQLEEKYREVCKLKTDLHIGYFNILEYFKLYRYLKRSNYDTICDFSGNFSGFVLLMAKWAGIKNRIAFYREARNKFPNDLFRRAYKNTVTFAMTMSATKILANSQDALNYFHPGWRNVPNKYNVIYNGFDIKNLSTLTKSEVRKKLDIPNDAFVIGHSGRLCEAKNHDMIFKMANRLCNQDKSIIFVLMGRDVKEKYQNMVEENHLQSQIRILGYRTDVLDVLKACDLFYFPSLTEGQPNSLIEAMLSGIPFVASNIASIKETTPRYTHNCLVSPTDEQENYEKLKEMIPLCKRNEGISCVEWAKENFDAEKLFQQFTVEL